MHRDFLVNIRPPYFDAFYFVDEELRESTDIPPHLFFKLIFFLEGNVTYEIQGEHYSMLQGDILLAPRYTPYRCCSLDGRAYRRMVIWFTPELLTSIDASGELLAFFEKLDRQKTGACFRFIPSYQNAIFNNVYSLTEELDYTKPFEAVVSYSLVTLALTGIYRAAVSNKTVDGKGSESARLVSEVVDYINKNLLADLSLDSIAERFFISKYHLARTFKKHMAVTVHNYIIQRRLTLARQKLYDGASPTKIYKSCGFSDYANFYRAFQKMYGTTPKEFCHQASTIMFHDGSDARDFPQAGPMK